MALFDKQMAHLAPDAVVEYDVTADGRRFLIHRVLDSRTAPAPTLTVVTNWLAEVKK